MTINNNSLDISKRWISILNRLDVSNIDSDEKYELHLKLLGMGQLLKKYNKFSNVLTEVSLTKESEHAEQMLKKLNNHLYKIQDRLEDKVDGWGRRAVVGDIVEVLKSHYYCEEDIGSKHVVVDVLNGDSTAMIINSKGELVSLAFPEEYEVVGTVRELLKKSDENSIKMEINLNDFSDIANKLKSVIKRAKK
jgi:hypothetical protein